MNAYGNIAEGGNLSAGGTITGDLALEKDLTVSGDTALADFTADNGVISGDLQVGTLVSDIKTEDTLIHVGVNNVADALNLGVIEEYNDGTTKYAGLVRYSGDKKQYIIDNTTPIPSGGTNISALSRGDLVIQDLQCRNAFASTSIQTPFTYYFRPTAPGNAQGSQWGTLDDINDEWFMGSEPATTNLVIKNKLGEKLMTFQQDKEIKIIDTLVGEGADQLLKLNQPDVVLEANIAGSGSFNIFKSQKSEGTIDIPSVVGDNAIISLTEANSYDGTSFKPNAQIAYYTTEAQTPTNHGGRMELRSTDVGATLPTTKITVADDVSLSATLDMKENDIQNVKLLDVEEMKIEKSGFSPYDIVIDDSGTLTLTRQPTNGLLEIRTSRMTYYHCISNNEGVRNQYFVSRNTIATPTAIINGAFISRQEGFPNDGVDFNLSSRIAHIATETHSATAHGTKITLSTVDDTTTTMTDKLTVDNNVEITNADLDMGGNDILNKLTAYSELYFKGNVSPTLQDPVNTYQEVVGTVSFGLNSQFTPAGIISVYDGLQTKVFKASVNVSWASGDIQNNIYSLAIFKNGVEIVSSTSRASLDNAAQWPRNCSCECLVSLSTTDYLDIRVKNSDSTQSVIITDLNFNITEI